MLRKIVDILLVEDNPGDVGLLQESLNQVRVPFRLRTVADGASAVALLDTCGAHDCPDLVILDLNLPGLSGHEVLKSIRANPVTASVPVIVLSSSQSTTDVERAYDAHANCFIVKPAELEEFLKVALAIEKFWLGVAELPSR